MSTFTFTASNGETFSVNRKKAPQFGLIVTDNVTGKRHLAAAGVQSTCNTQAGQYRAAMKRSGKPGFGIHDYTLEIVPAN